jgi:heme exporter protein A
MLSLQNLQVNRGGRSLFRPLSADILPGQIWQLCGNNGSGKTSLLRVICGLSPLSQGQIVWQQQRLAECIDDYWQKLIYIAHQTALNPLLTTRQNLDFYAGLFSASSSLDHSQILTNLGLSQQAALLAGQLSAGQQRRLSLSRLFLTQRPLWILDEPFSALDQTSVVWLQAAILRHTEQGGSVIFTSHQQVNLPEVQTVVLQA